MSTLKTIAGFLYAFICRHTPLKIRSNAVSDIYNYLLIDKLFATSGQPSEAQFKLIKDAGYRTVVNLAPTSVLENSVVNERKILEELDLVYIHISVDFKNPTTRDFQRFVNSIENKNFDEVWVHCAANMRVSAFTYRYRVEILGEDQEVAKKDLFKIWSPMGVWKKFVGSN